MTSRQYTEDDYALICSWWTKRGFPCIAAALLPQNGVIVDEKAAGFLYSTDSGVAWLEWVVSDPDSAPTGEAVQQVVYELVEAAKQLGFSVILTTTNHAGLIAKYTKAGFTVGDVEMTNLSVVL